MKKIIIVSTAFLMSNLIFAQDFTYGAKATVGMSTINTGNSSETLKTLVEDCNCLKRFDMTSSPGLNFSVGAFSEYGISEKLKVGLDVNYVSTNFTINTSHVFDEMNREILDASNKVNIGTLFIPVYAKYYILPEKNVYGKLGLGLNLILSSQVSTSEALTTEEYNQTGVLLGSSVGSSVTYEAELNSPRSTNFMGVLGVGIDLNDNLSLGIDYNIAFTTNSFYSSDVAYTNATHEGNIFTEEFNNELNLDGKRLDEFRFGSINFNVAYNF